MTDYDVYRKLVDDCLLQAERVTGDPEARARVLNLALFWLSRAERLNFSRSDGLALRCRALTLYLSARLLSNSPNGSSVNSSTPDLARDVAITDQHKTRLSALLAAYYSACKARGIPDEQAEARLQNVVRKVSAEYEAKRHASFRSNDAATHAVAHQRFRESKVSGRLTESTFWLEPISKSFEEDDEAGKLHQAKKFFA